MPHSEIKDIDGVVRHLDDLIDDAKRDQSKRGYFMALYRGITIRVLNRIEEGAFHDNERMARFDVVFARYYFEALHRWMRHEPPIAPWSLAFEHIDAEDLLIVQHLLLGMNAHITFDLAHAAAETSPGESIHGLREDFYIINDLLKAAIDDVQAGLNKAAPAMALVDLAGLRLDEMLAGFGMVKARDRAWAGAVALATASNEHLRSRAQVDLWRRAMNLGHMVRKPFKGLTSVVRRTEFDHKKRENVDDVIEMLRVAVG